VSLAEAVTRGLAPDGGLYMPERIPVLPQNFFDTIREKSLHEIAFVVAQAFVEDEVPEVDLRKLVAETLNFEIPLKVLEARLQPGSPEALLPKTSNISVLELFHGPTMAFKDVGARFMARMLSAVRKGSTSELTVLVATSGDTGSAVASGFFNVPGIKVVILYPSKRVSDLQEKQLTTMGSNITALEVEGSFDDCQHMVKEAFQDAETRAAKELTSANSINIARLIPQMFYYFWAYAQLSQTKKELVVSVPSGNFGNLTAGLMAKRMGLPVAHFVASTNVNNVVPEYLQSGLFETRPSVQTISNAMDVGNPSNFARMLDLYGGDVREMHKDVLGLSFTDEETKAAVHEVYTTLNYMLDPHGAVGYLGLRTYLEHAKDHADQIQGVFLETAHPAKFQDVVEKTLGTKVEIPTQLQVYLERKKEAKLISKNFNDLKQFLLA